MTRLPERPSVGRPGRPRRFLGLPGRALCRHLVWPLVALLTACAPPSSSPGEPAAASTGGLTVAPLSPGLAFELDGLPLTLAELTQVESAWGALQPAESSPGLRRRALTNSLLPRLALAAAHREARQLALATALDLASQPPQAQAPTPPPGGWPPGFTPDPGAPPATWGPGAQAGVLSGGFRELGFELWARARAHLGWGRPGERDWPAGALPARPAPSLPSPWLGPVEGLGRFGLLRILEAEPASDPGLERFSLQVIVLPFVATEALQDPEAYLRGRRLVAATHQLAESVQARLVALLAGQGATAQEQSEPPASSTPDPSAPEAGVR